MKFLFYKKSLLKKYELYSIFSSISNSIHIKIYIIKAKTLYQN